MILLGDTSFTLPPDPPEQDSNDKLTIEKLARSLGSLTDGNIRGWIEAGTNDSGHQLYIDDDKKYLVKCQG